MANIYASDLKPNLLKDSFMGEGFEKLLEEAREKDIEVIVGEYYKKPKLEE